MRDDPDPPTFGGFTPALPSRATGEAKPLTPLPQTAAAPKKARKRAVKKAPPKPRRKKRVAMTKKPLKAFNQATKVPKSPNRPLEAKNRLHSVIKVVAGMSNSETAAFLAAMSLLEDMSGPARRKVIAALSQVYEA
jgi:hypothetical protein